MFRWWKVCFPCGGYWLNSLMRLILGSGMLPLCDSFLGPVATSAQRRFQPGPKTDACAVESPLPLESHLWITTWTFTYACRTPWTQSGHPDASWYVATLSRKWQWKDMWMVPDKHRTLCCWRWPLKPFIRVWSCSESSDWLSLPLQKCWDTWSRIAELETATQKRLPGSTPLRQPSAFKRQEIRRLADPPRAGPSSHSEPVVLHHVSPCRPGRHCALPISPLPRMEEEQAPERRTNIETDTPVVHPQSGEGKISEDSTMQDWRPTPSSECEVQASSGRQELASASMVPSDQGVGDQWQATINGRHDADTGRSDSAMPEGECGGAISLPEFTGDSRCSHTLEVGPRCQGADGAPCLSEHGSSSVWQLVSFRMKIHCLSQSKLADQVQQILYPKSKKWRCRSFLTAFAPWFWPTTVLNAMSTLQFGLSAGHICSAMIWPPRTGLIFEFHSLMLLWGARVNQLTSSIILWCNPVLCSGNYSAKGDSKTTVTFWLFCLGGWEPTR